MTPREVIKNSGTALIINHEGEKHDNASEQFLHFPSNDSVAYYVMNTYSIIQCIYVNLLKVPPA